MKRRNLLKAISAGAFTSCGLVSPRVLFSKDFPNRAGSSCQNQDRPLLQTQYFHDEFVKDAIYKGQAHDTGSCHDNVISGSKLTFLKSAHKRLRRVQKLVGYAHFNLLDFNMLLKYARNYSVVGSFTKQELDFIDEIFLEDATNYGFLGDKVITDISAKVIRRETKKIPGTGHYLFKGEPLNTYLRIKNDIGDNIILTSGIRSVVKQLHLFLQKAVNMDGNLSLASRSLAPPGHSYHGIGDFDVGKIGFGRLNFSEVFATTSEYKRLTELGYIGLRYPKTNPYGVRFEPWHVKVV